MEANRSRGLASREQATSAEANEGNEVGRRNRGEDAHKAAGMMAVNKPGPMVGARSRDRGEWLSQIH